MIPPRFPLAVLPTPLVRAHRLEAVLGRGRVLLKRDDLAGFAVGGNKTRPLEYLLGRALADRCDVLVTGGGPGSNFCPAAAVAARAAGLDCELIICGDNDRGDGYGSANLAIAAAAGACIRPTGDPAREALDAAIAERAADLTTAGRRPFPVPRGGSTPLGAVGFAVAAAELAGQLDQSELAGGAEPALVVLPVGSGSSCAGLLAAGPPWPVLGISVSRPLQEITSKVHALGQACARLLGYPPPRPRRLEIVDARGLGFGITSQADRAAACLALHTEGLLLDDTYGAKAFAVLTQRVGDVRGPVVFWHTGGVVPAVAALRQRISGGRM